MTLTDRLREEARLIQYGERACVPGLLHEAADRIAALEDRLELVPLNTDGTPAEALPIGNCDGIGCRNETIKLLQASADRNRTDAARYRWLRDTDHEAEGRESFDITFYDNNEPEGPYDGSWNTWSMDELDEMIDAAMAAKDTK